MVKVEKFVVGPLGENSFVLSDETSECIFIDPGFYFEEEHQEIVDYIATNNLKPVKIINTHCHFDHIMGVEFIRNKYKIEFHAHSADVFWIEKAVEQANMFGFKINSVTPMDKNIDENDSVKFGNTELNVIHVPGHSPGHVVFYNEESNILIAGDVLFYGSIGRTDLPGGDYQKLIKGIKAKLFILPDDTKVYTGHGPETTIGFEKRNNPFLT
ncbi:MAG: MBL fold metallo-hydrolase [Prolixibacteraceae bacterium]|nr:MBL fold metallo-hydrolase [Prolixibacteraceae bacterium]